MSVTSCCEKTHQTAYPSVCSDALARPAGRLDQWWARLQRWRQLRRERLQLRELNEHSLRDIGLTRMDVEHESRRRFWDDSGWRRNW